MTARLQIRHVTGFSYAGLSRASYNEARMTPVTSAHQVVLDASITTTPRAVQANYRDYFGNVVTAFDLQEPHDRLEVCALAMVETSAPSPTPRGWTVAERTEASVVDRFAEYLAATPRTTLPPEVALEAKERFGGLDANAAAQEISAWVRAKVTYVSGSTSVTTTAAAAWEQGQGVCQDLSHITLGALRAAGVPARYVSGYLHPKSDAPLGEVVKGQSHAWVEYYSGQWVAMDPTNGSEVGLQHVVVATGREYGDVSPLKGIYHGEPSRALGVVVEIARLS